MIATQHGLRVLFLVLFLSVGAAASIRPNLAPKQPQVNNESKNFDNKQAEAKTMNVQYLEIVTPSVAETCDALARSHDVDFSEPITELGNARVAELKGGGRIGVRAPLRESEEPVVRPYILVDDIEAAVKAAEKAGANVALSPTEIPGQGTISIYIIGGIEHGLWQP